jgi:hypothetical protein
MLPIGTSIEYIEEREEKQRKLRELAAWYREIAERAGDPAIWEARLRTAKEFEQEADRLMHEPARRRETVPNSR